MQNEIIVNAESGETRVAILERGHFAELHTERASGKGVAGNVVKGRVMRVLPGMQAAFVDIGLEKAGFLYVGDYFAEPAPGENGGTSSAPRRATRRGRGNHRPPPSIETVLEEGQEIVVQIAKEPIGTKGARITSHVSIAGRHLVLTPWSPRVGVSRRIDSDKERKRLRETVQKLRPKDLGFIIRTAGDGLRESDLEADIRYLTTVWAEVQVKQQEQAAPCVLYTEPDLPLRVIRDFTNSDTKRIVIDDSATYQRLTDFVERFIADPRPKLEHYEGKHPLYEEYGLEPQIHANLERKVRLKSGGSLVIDQSEALTAIDVNSGRYVGKSDLEETVYKTNLEAVKEVVNQLRFRNIGGIIIIDLIDMESRENREKVYRALNEALRADKSKTNLLKISELGLVEMTRKRTRENLVQMLCEPCSYCEGRGYVLSPESMGFRIMREVRRDLPLFCGRKIAVAVNSKVAAELLGEQSDALTALSEELGCEIEVHGRPGMYQEQFEIVPLDEGPPIELQLAWLTAPKSPDEAASEELAEARGELAEASDEPPESSEEVAPSDDDPAHPGNAGPEGSVRSEPEPQSVDAAEPNLDRPQAADDAGTSLDDPLQSRILPLSAGSKRARDGDGADSQAAATGDLDGETPLSAALATNAASTEASPLEAAVEPVTGEADDARRSLGAVEGEES